MPNTAILMKKKIPYLVLLIAVFTSLMGCGEKEETREATPVNVKILEVGKNDGNSQQSRKISYSGTIKASKTVKLSFQVSGTVKQIPVEMGGFVKKGDLVAAIDATTYQNQYEAKQAQANLAKENFERINEVYQKGSIAEIRMIEARSNYEQAQSSANAAYQNVKHTKLFAPIDGYVGDKMMEAGDVANPGQPVVELLDIHTVKAIVPVPDDEINTYKTGGKALVKIDVLQKEEFNGRISEISVQSNRENPIYTLKISIDNPQQKIKPGMSCKVFLPNNTKENSKISAFAVPVESVSVTEEGRNFVYVVDTTENKAKKRFVETGKLYNNEIAITSGLDLGDKLIVSGYHKLTHNTSVKIVQ